MQQLQLNDIFLAQKPLKPKKLDNGEQDINYYW